MGVQFEIFRKRRFTKQLLMAAVFIAVLAGGWVFPLLGYFIPFCMILGMAIAFVKGRKWCDWYCPRGSFSDAMAKYISFKKEIPAFFKGLPLRIGMFSFLMLVMILQIVRRWPDPFLIGAFFVTLLTITTIIGIVLSVFIHQRTWCCFCPIGSVSNWVGRNRRPLLIDSGICTECKLCYKVCPIQVSPYKFKKEGVQLVKDGDCLKCMSCVNACPKQALSS